MSCKRCKYFDEYNQCCNNPTIHNQFRRELSPLRIERGCSQRRTDIRLSDDYYVCVICAKHHQKGYCLELPSYRRVNLCSKECLEAYVEIIKEDESD